MPEQGIELFDHKNDAVTALHEFEHFNFQTMH